MRQGMRRVVFRSVCTGSAAAAALTALGACSSSPPAPAPAVSTTTVVVTTSGTSSPTSSPTSSRSTTSGSSTTSARGTACKAGSAKATVVTDPNGASAGRVNLLVQVTNSGSTACTVRGYPGVSLVTGTQGQQLGAPAQRGSGTESLVTLAPGGKATAKLSLTQAANEPSCGVTAAEGFRVYLPDDTAAQFAPLAQQGCSNAAVVLMQVSPFAS